MKMMEIDQLTAHASIVGRPDRPSTREPQATAISQLRLGVIDCYRFSRECLIRAFADVSAMLTVHPFTTAADYIAADPHATDLILYYSHAPAWDEAAQADVAALQGHPERPPLIVMSDAAGAQQSAAMRQAMGAGARGFIPTRTTGIPIMLAVIRFIEAGGTYAPLDHMFDGPPEPTLPASVAVPDAVGGKWCFTLRQKQVFALLQQGYPNKTIAHALCMSESTVKVHVRNIMRLTGATNRTQAAYRVEGWEMPPAGQSPREASPRQAPSHLCL